MMKMLKIIKHKGINYIIMPYEEFQDHYIYQNLRTDRNSFRTIKDFNQTDLNEQD